MIKRILVALSGTPFTPAAIKYATEIASANDATVTGVTVVDPARMTVSAPEPIGGGGHAASIAASQRLAITKERVEEQIAAFETACDLAHVSYTVDRESGDPLDLLHDLSRYHDLVVFGLRGLFEYGVMRNPDDQVTRLVARGVRPILAVAEEHRPINRVMIAYNGTMESAKSMKQFIARRLWPNAELSIVSCDHQVENADQLAADAKSYCQAHGFTVSSDVLTGDPEEALLNHAASWDADMVVMGCTNRNRVAQFLLGDTALRAIRDSEIPLFLSQ